MTASGAGGDAGGVHGEGALELAVVAVGAYGIHENGPRYGVNITETGTTILLWILIGLLFACAGSFVAMYFIIKNTNAICESYNRMNGIA